LSRRTPPAQRLRVAVTDEEGHPITVRGLAPWLTRVAPAKARGAVAIALVSDRRMRALNRKYRRKNYPTDVLSFSPGPERPAYRRTRRRSPAPSLNRYLGDVVIAQGVARKQARTAGHSQLVELRLLALHGLLHLLGYDHERDKGEMERLERKLRQKGGL